MHDAKHTQNSSLGRLAALALALLSGALPRTAAAQATPPGEPTRKPIEAKKPDYSPYPDRRIPTRVLWGVAHVHTGYSFDSGMFGVTLTPDDLFRVATGGEVVMDNGQRFKQDRALDWVSITDHAEYMGISDQIREGSPELLANPQGKRWYEMSQKGPQEGVKAAIEAVVSMQSGKPVFDASKLVGAAWAHATAAAEKWNKPGVFTTLHGFEWTCAPGGNNLHRTVIFRDGADRVSQVIPFSTFDSQDPAALWKYMDTYAKKTGGQVLAIPHNGNLSNGIMYTAETFDGKPMDRPTPRRAPATSRSWRRRRSRATARPHPYLSPNDEFANFERWDFDKNKKVKANERPARQLRALRAQAGTGAGREARRQPVSAGMIGGNDAHVGVVTTREDNFFGEFSQRIAVAGALEDACSRRSSDGTVPLASVWNEQAAGLGGVWATENTREAVWDALKRKEVYATTGDRPIVRVFAGWDFVPKDRDRSDFAANGYAHGVPMGGNLSNAPAGKRPAFMVQALRDPEGPNLDRIQVIKGWLGTGRQDARAHLRRGRLRRARDRPGRPLQDPGRQHRGRRERELHEHHRRRPRCRPTGRTLRSTPTSARSTTCASSRSRRRAGPLTTRSATASRCPTTFR